MSKMKIGILGVGLIGGSIIKRLVSQRSEVNVIEIHTWNHTPRHNETLKTMDVTPHNSVAELLNADVMKSGAQPKPYDFIIVSTPIEVLEQMFAEISGAYAKNSATLSENTVILDVASVKELPARLVEQYNLSPFYVGTHPMFGTEFTGFENASPNLGDHATWAVCGEKSSTNVTKTVDLIENHLVGKTVLTNAIEHDKAVALSSHLPHVLAYELASIISEESPENGLSRILNAASFHGATRVAHGNSQMFKDMLMENSTEIATLLRTVSNDLKTLADVLESNDEPVKRKSIHHFIARSDTFRTNESKSGENQPNLPVHKHDADGFVKCQCGKQHWGLNGAAGLFLVRTNEYGEVSHILLQQRAMWTVEGGTWGTPGGAINHGENPIEGALREAKEEAGINPEDINVLGELTRDHGDWRFTTVIAKEEVGHTIEPYIVDQESLDVAWKTVAEVRKLPLLKAFGRELDELLDTVHDLA